MNAAFPFDECRSRDAARGGCTVRSTRRREETVERVTPVTGLVGAGPRPPCASVGRVHTPVMSRLRVLAMLVAIVSGCGGPTPTTPPGSGAVTTSSAPTVASASPVVADATGFDAIQANAVAHVGETLDGLDDRGQLLDHMGVRAGLGPNADRILALIQATETAVDAQQVKVQTASTGIVNAVFQKFQSPYIEFRDQMSDALDGIGRSGGGNLHIDMGSQSNTQTDGGWSGTTSQQTTADVTISGSDVKVELVRDITNSATDVASGTSILNETIKHRIVGELDVCPPATGQVPASLTVGLEADSSTFPLPGGGIATHATGTSTRSSQFQGPVDDMATLGAVQQAFTNHEMFHKTTSAPGQADVTSDGEFTMTATNINDGVPAAGEFHATLSDWSTSTGTTSATGDVTAEMFAPMPWLAGSDYSTMDASYVAAQTLWRNTRCVIVTAPTYIPASAFANNAIPTHTEEVDKGSTTVFQVGVDHRFGQTVTAKIVTELDGKESLQPGTIPKPPGTLTYVAPDKDGLDAKAILTSTSKQGIGHLVLTFHTGAEKLKLSISGTLVTSGFGVSYTTTFSTSNLVLSRQPDGSFRGSSPITASLHLNGDIPCPNPFHEKGTLVLNGKRPPRAIANEGQPNEVVDESQPRQWKVGYDEGTKAITSGTCLGQSLGQLMQLGANGITGGFMLILFGMNADGTPAFLTFPPEGGTIKVNKTTTLGPSTNTIVATVTGTVISESGK